MEIGVKVNMPSHHQPFKRNIVMQVWGEKKIQSKAKTILGKKFSKE